MIGIHTPVEGVKDLRGAFEVSGVSVRTYEGAIHRVLVGEDRLGATWVEGTPEHPFWLPKERVWKPLTTLQAIKSTSVNSYQWVIENEKVTPGTWCSISLEMRKSDGSIVKADLLRPLWWLGEPKVEVGGTITLSMPEMGMEGDAKVLSIGPCMAESRKGDSKYRVVTGKFAHENVIVIDLFFNANLNDPLGVTLNHRLWSQTRNGWVEAGQLKVGEYVKTNDGIAQLTMRHQRPGRHKVYNLEVHKDHTYYVSQLGILAHNSCSARVGGSGKYVSHTVKHPTRKRALSAATRDSAKGQKPIFHKATQKQPAHYHPVDSKGKIIPIHHDFGKPNPLAKK